MTDIAKRSSRPRTRSRQSGDRQKSRDFWYSPVLKRQLDHVTADLIVSRGGAEVVGARDLSRSASR
jgi:hypothetical protein